MAKPRSTAHEFADDALPERLRADLLRLHSAPAVATALDEAILGDARAGHRRRAIWRPIGRVLMVSGSLAAAVAIFLLAHAGPLPSRTAPVAQSDLPPRGEVSMLSAYRLATLLQTRDRLDPAWDVNHDGVINQTDVDLLAARAVHLDLPGPAAGATQ